MNIVWKSKYKKAQLFFALAMALLYFFTLVSIEVSHLQQGYQLRQQLKKELVMYVQSELSDEGLVNGYVNDNESMIDKSLEIILGTAHTQLVHNIELEQPLTEENLNKWIAYRDFPNNLEVYAINKNDLFKSLKYRYILDAFRETNEIVFIDVDTKQESGISTKKRIAFMYDPSTNIILVVEKTLNAEFTDISNVMENLYTYNLVTNDDTMGDIVVCNKDGTIIRDNHRIFEGDSIDVYDKYTHVSLKELIWRSSGSVVQFTLPGEEKSPRKAYVLYNEKLKRYYINSINTDVLKNELEVYHVEMLRNIIAISILNIFFMVVSAYRYTKKLLE